jgi:hypothetical protein
MSFVVMFHPDPAWFARHAEIARSMGRRAPNPSDYPRPVRTGVTRQEAVQYVQRNREVGGDYSIVPGPDRPREA